MNRFIAKIVFAGLLAAQFAPAAAFAETRAGSAQITPVVILRALFKAVAMNPQFTSARRSGPKDKDIVAEFARKKGVTGAALARLQEEAAAAIARDLRQVLRSSRVTDMLRAEKDGMLGAARAVSSAQFSAQVVTKPFAQKPAPAKRVSILDGIVAVAQAGDVPSDAEIKAADASVKAAADKVTEARIKAAGAQSDVNEAELAGDEKIIAEEKSRLAQANAIYAQALVAFEKANAERAKLRLKKSIADSVANCAFDPKGYYGDVKRTIAQAVIDELLTRVGGLIKNPYLPEYQRFQTPIKELFKIGGGPEPSAETWDAISSGTKDGGELYEAWITFEFVYALQLFPSENKTVSLRELFERTIQERTSFPRTIRSEFEKQGILNMGGLADAIDDFLGIQKVLLFEDLADLQKLLCAANDAIAAEMKKLEAVIRKTEDTLNEGKKKKRKLGDVADPAAAQAFNTALKSYLGLNCSDTTPADLENFIISLLKSKIHSKIYDAIKLSTFDDVKAGLIGGVHVSANGKSISFDVAFLNAVNGDKGAMDGLLNAATAALDVESPGFIEGISEAVSKHQSLRLSILFLRELKDYSKNPNTNLTTEFNDASKMFGSGFDLIRNAKKIVAVQELLIALDRFVRRVRDILAGTEGRLETSVKAKYCSIKARIEKREKEKEEAMKKIEQKGEEVKVGGGGTGGGGACSNPGGVFCQRSQVSGEYENCAVNPVGLVCNLGTGARYYEPEPNASCACTYLCIDSPPPPDNPADFGNGPNLYAAQGSGCANPGTWEQQ